MSDKGCALKIPISSPVIKEPAVTITLVQAKAEALNMMWMSDGRGMCALLGFWSQSMDRKERNGGFDRCPLPETIMCEP